MANYNFRSWRGGPQLPETVKGASLGLQQRPLIWGQNDRVNGKHQTDETE